MAKSIRVTPGGKGIRLGLGGKSVRVSGAVVSTPGGGTTTPTTPVTPAVQVPVLSVAQNYTVSEAAAVGAIVGLVSATNSPTAYNIIAGNADGRFAISNAGAVTLAAPVDYEDVSVYQLTVTASNSAGTSVSAVVGIQVVNVVEQVAPVVSANQTLSVNSDAAVGTVVGTVGAANIPTAFAITGGTGAPFLSISSTGIVTVTASMASVVAASVLLTVTASNAAGVSPAVTVTVSVKQPSTTPAVTVQPVVDALPAPLFAYGYTRLRTGHAGRAGVIRRASDSALRDVMPTADGRISAADRAWVANTTAVWTLLTDQSGGNGDIEFTAGHEPNFRVKANGLVGIEGTGTAWGRTVNAPFPSGTGIANPAMITTVVNLYSTNTPYARVVSAIGLTMSNAGKVDDNDTNNAVFLRYLGANQSQFVRDYGYAGDIKYTATDNAVHVHQTVGANQVSVYVDGTQLATATKNNYASTSAANLVLFAGENGPNNLNGGGHAKCVLYMLIGAGTASLSERARISAFAATITGLTGNADLGGAGTGTTTPGSGTTTPTTPVVTPTTPTTPAPAIDTNYPVVAFAPIPLTIEGTGAPAGSVHTQGVLFQRGHVMPGTALTFKAADGTKCETQYDVAPCTFWGDGSIRFTSLHIVPPTLANGVKNAGTLVKEATVAGTAINLATALEGRKCVVEVKNGTNVFTLDVVANLPAARWYQGNVKSSARVLANVPRAATGDRADPVLQVDISIDRAGVITCDARVIAQWVYKASQGSYTYDIKVTGDSNVVQWQQAAMPATLYTSWAPELRWNAAGVAQARAFYHRINTEYASRTGTIYNYDQAMGFPETKLADYATQRAAAGWNTPYGKRNMRVIMGGTGGGNEIGYTTQSQAAWLLTGDRRALEYMVDTADAAHTWPIFMKNEAYEGRWFNPVDQPWGRCTYHDSAFTESQSSKADQGGWSMDTAHWGDLFLTPYVATARRSFCDGTMGIAVFSVMEKNAGGERLIPTGGDANTAAGRTARLAGILADGRGMNMRNNVQTRTYGWCMRQHMSAIAVCPASETPHGDLFMRGAIGTYKTLISEIPLATVNQKSAYGFPMDNALAGNEGGLASPWQAVFVGANVVRAARLEVPGAITYMEWADNWYSGGFSHPDMNAADMTRYRLWLLNGDTRGDVNSTKWNSFKDIMTEVTTPGHGPSYGPNYSSSTAAASINGLGDYERRYQAFITQLYDLFADHGKSTTKVAAALTFLQNAPKVVTHQQANDFYIEGLNSIVRRGQTRQGI